MSDEQMQSAPKGYEVSAQAQIGANIQKAIMEDINLRKWCVEKALEDVATGPVVSTAQSILNFLTSGIHLKE